MEEERKSLRERLQVQRERHRERRVVVRIVFAATGLVVLLGGLAMLVLPGPGLLTVAIGLSMLALEFAWAERLLGKTLDRLERIRPKERSLALRILV
ncbi:MAG: PGPGW domain-containing protein, partial [Gaiellaceae bacterium]